MEKINILRFKVKRWNSVLKEAEKLEKNSSEGKRNAHKKIGKYSLNYKYSSDRDLFYKMIVKYKLKGTCTKKNEILAKFDTQGWLAPILIVLDCVNKYQDYQD